MAKTKGTQYIAQKLVKYYPNKFSNYKTALPEARLVLAQIQDAKERVTVKNIKSKISKPRRKIKGAPVLPIQMSEPINYFDLQVYIELIARLPDNLFFTSKIIPSSVKQPLKGGSLYSYEQLFKPFVDYCNEMKNLTSEDDGRYETDWYVKCTELVPDKTKKGIWTSKIISCDSNGDEFDYGFDPKKETVMPEKPILSGLEKTEEALEAPKGEEIPKIGPSIADDREFLLNLEKAKEKTAIAETAKIKEKMEYVKMLKELGFTPAEIKIELNKL